MDKRIEDYLHLYLGCEVVYKGEIHFLCDVSKPYRTNDKTIATFSVRPNKKGFRSTIYSLPNFDDIKLILRPLSYMTQDEAMYCVKIAYNSVYGHDPEFIRIEMVDTNDEAAGIVCEEPGWLYGFSVTKNGIDFSANGDYLHIPVFEITRYLISRGFDIFGLTEVGLTIDKTKMNTNG